MKGQSTQLYQTAPLLDSWEAIAHYLGRSVRTVQRWSAKYGLPVHRPSLKHGSVLAYVEELDNWLKSRAFSEVHLAEDIHSPQTVPFEAMSGAYVQMAPNPLPTILNTDKLHAAELVRTCGKMWHVLSYGNLPRITRLYHEAISLDQENAEALSGLCQALVIEGISGMVPPPQAYAAAKRACDAALEIAPNQRHTRLAQAWIDIVCRRDWQRAEREFDELLRTHQESVGATMGRAFIYLAAGDISAASAFLEALLPLTGLSIAAETLHCWCDYLAGKFDYALAHIDQIKATGHLSPMLCGIEALSSAHLEDQSISIRRIEDLILDYPEDAVIRGALGYACALHGDTSRAIRVLEALSEHNLYNSGHEPYAMALIEIGLDQWQQAVKHLEASERLGALWSFGLQSDPIVAQLQNDPNFRHFMTKTTWPVSHKRESSNSHN
jgi:hypothetical protein